MGGFIMKFTATEQQENNFQYFVKGLTELSKKYNIAIRSIGGVCIFQRTIICHPLLTQKILRQVI